jgi:hypothetical protein
MKKLLITTVGLFAVALSAYSQGSIFFSNEPLSTGNEINAPVFAEDGTTRLAGAAFQAQLYARPAGSTALYQAVGSSVGFLTTTPNGTGYWTPTSLNIPGIAPAAQAEVISRVWRVADGGTWDAARAANRGWGESTPITLTLGGGTVLPARMIGLTSFQLVPEPSTIALGILGGLGTLMLVRRRK